MSRLAALAASVALLASVLAAAPALANNDSVSCTFAGRAPTDPVPSVENTLNEPLRDGAVSGFYATGTCALTHTDGGLAVGPVTMYISGGRFLNLVCGTGIWGGHLWIWMTSVPLVGSWANYGYEHFDFTTFFAGGNGAMVITHATDESDLEVPPLGVGAGYMNIVPDVLGGSGDCIDQDASSFQVQGAFTAES